MNIDDERKKAADQAAGQREYLRQALPDSLVLESRDSEKLKFQIVKICVESYVDDAEKEKKRLLDEVEKEKMKNRDIKDIAERLALELDKAVPGHQLANDTLAMLLENKMMPGQAPLRKKKT